MNNHAQVFVRLLDEGVDVWRPVHAERQSEGVYKIAVQPYDRNVEVWEFGPGEEVVCELMDSSDGQFLAATRSVESSG